jgi:hypothetical protein
MAYSARPKKVELVADAWAHGQLLDAMLLEIQNLRKSEGHKAAGAHWAQQIWTVHLGVVASTRMNASTRFSSSPPPPPSTSLRSPRMG